MIDLNTIRGMITAGNKAEAMRELARVLGADPRSLEGWLLMAQALDDPARQADCYRQVLKLDPGNPLATQRLEALQSPAPQPAAPAPEPPASAPASPPPAPPANIPPPSGTPAFEPTAGQLPAAYTSPRTPSGSLMESRLRPFGTGSLQSSQPTPSSQPAQAPQPTPAPQPSLLEREKKQAEPAKPLFDSFKPLNSKRPKPGEPPPPPPITPAVGEAPKEKQPKKPKSLAFRLFATIVIFAGLAVIVYYGAQLFAQYTPATPTPQPTWTVEFIPTKTPQNTWTPLPTQTPRPTLTPGPVFISPRIAYLYDNNIFLWRVGAAQEIAGLAAQPFSISPDGSLVVFTRQDTLWLKPVDGGEEKELLGREALQALQEVSGGGNRTPAWTGWIPGSQKLLVSTALDRVNTGDLTMLDLATGKQFRLLDDGEDHRFYPSPDGAWIGVSGQSSIQLLNMKTGLASPLFTFEPVITASETPFFPALLWAQDAKSLMLAIPPHDVANESTAPTVIWRLSVEGSEPERMAEINSNGGRVEISPDLNKVLYQLAIGEDPAYGELHLADINGEGDTILQGASPLQLIGWTPDSRQYLFRKPGDSSILVGGVGQSAIKPLSESVQQYADGTPSWISPTLYLIQNADGLYLGTLKGTAELIVKGAPGSISIDFYPKP